MNVAPSRVELLNGSKVGMEENSFTVKCVIVFKKMSPRDVTLSLASDVEKNKLNSTVDTGSEV